MKTLYVNGDSWTVGTAMQDDPTFHQFFINDSEAERVSKCTWGRQLSSRLGYRFINDAQAGGSNYRILRTTCDFILNYPKEYYKDLVVIIGWTNADRNELYMGNKIASNDKWCIFNNPYKFSECKDNLVPRDVLKNIDEYQRLYITEVYDEYASLVTYFNQKFLLSSMLENLGIKYYFFDSLRGLWDLDSSENKEFYLIQQEKISNKYMKIDASWLEYCVANNLKITECWHPYIESHDAWADLIFSILVELYGLK